MTTPNRHAALMRQYTEELILDPHAYKNWQYKRMSDSPDYWLVCSIHPDWYQDWDYRRNAKTITIGGIEVPEPMRVAPQSGTDYFVPNPRSLDL